MYLTNQTNKTMIVTLDGFKLKKGDHAWEIGITTEGVYTPTRGTYGSSKDPIHFEDKCWKSYRLCKQKCDEKNHK